MSHNRGFSPGRSGCGRLHVGVWRGETDTVDKMEKRVEHDLEYIRNWALVWDLKIILLTMFGAKRGANAY